MKRILSIVLTCLFSLALLAWVFAEVDLGLALEYFSRIRGEWLLICLGGVVLSYVFRGLRWKLLLPESDYELKEGMLIHACSAGFMAIVLLPLRAGEFVRPFLLSKSAPVSMTAALASVFIERVIDIIAVLAIVLLFLPGLENIPEVVHTGITAFTGISILCVGFVFTLCALREKGKKIFVSIISSFSFLPGTISNKLVSAYDDVVAGLSAINSLKKAFLVTLTTVGLWCSITLVYESLVVAFGLEAYSGLGLAITGLVALAIAAPSAPGFLGTFQFGCVLAMTELYGIDRNLSVSYSIVAHLLQMAFAVVAGMVSLKVLGFSFSDVLPGKSNSNKSNSGAGFKGDPKEVENRESKLSPPETSDSAGQQDKPRRRLQAQA